MCGFAGFWSLTESHDDPASVAAAMNAAIEHRGPDDTGEWCDGNGSAVLGFRRLAILDLSPNGHQPMTSVSGRYVMTFNGEIYNFADLRADLLTLGYTFRGHSDTEILLAAVESWGLVPTIQRCVGMFAIALWDREDKTLHLMRDRMGEKPLYYGNMGGTLLYGSELKALRAHPAWRGDIDRGAVALFLRHNYVPAPYSIYKHVRKVIPGTIVTIRAGRFDDPETTIYWSAREMAERGLASPLRESDDAMIATLDDVLRRTIRAEMVADVPLGAFLSGGVDSSALVALMQAQSSTPVKTFTIGFHEEGYNEASHAQAVANHLGTDHTELYVTPSEAMAVIPRLPVIYDEPFADSSQIPTFLVAQLARQHVTVSLSGEGGDELFAGYNRYFWGERLWRKLAPIPRGIRAGIGRSLQSVTPGRWDSVFSHVGPMLPSRYRVVAPGHKIHKAAAFLSADSADAMYRRAMTHWPDPSGMTGTLEPSTVLTTPSSWPAFDDVVHRMMYFDMMTELPDDILVKVDRATMAVSLESRAPFLDHRVAELAWRIPLHQKVRNGEGKWILRQLLYKYVPRALIERPKMGFGVPIDSWLRGPIKEWASTLLEPTRLAREGFFDPKTVTQAWNEHQRGERNNSHLLWGILMFQGWLETQS